MTALPTFRDAARQGLISGGTGGLAVGLVVSLYLLIVCLIDMPWKDDIVLWLVFLGCLFGQVAAAWLAGLLTGLCTSLGVRIAIGYVQSPKPRIVAAIVVGGCVGLLIGLGIATLISGGRDISNARRFPFMVLIGAWGVLGAVCGAAGTIKMRSLSNE